MGKVRLVGSLGVRRQETLTICIRRVMRKSADVCRCRTWPARHKVHGRTFRIQRNSVHIVLPILLPLAVSRGLLAKMCLGAAEVEAHSVSKIIGMSPTYLPLSLTLR